MVNKTMGNIILNGGTTEQIRKEFRDFPLNPTKEYFCNLGYKESTANNYLYKLRNNDKQRVSANSNNKSQATEEFSTYRLVKSENADYDNLLVDTSALGCFDAIRLIEKAKRVTFINATIKEMDTKKNVKKDAPKHLKILASNIRLYSGKILEDTNKYMLSTFSGLNDEKYPDNVLIQYLLILPKQIRPTIIATDRILTDKAEMWSLPYILFNSSKKI